jgi:hypothetical protein
VQDGERILARGEVCGKIEAERATDGALREAAHQGALGRLQLRPPCGEKSVDLRLRQCAQPQHAGAGADGGQ